MKMRDLARRAGSTTVCAWPPIWAVSFQPGRDTMVLPGDGVLEAVMRHEDDDALLRLTMRFDAREHSGILTWVPPPALATVEGLLRANLGREIRSIGELDV